MHDALAAKVAGEFLDQLRMFQRRGIDGYLVGPGLKASGRLLARPEASRHGKRYVDPLGAALHPGDIERAAFRARRDVVEDELVGDLVRIAERMLNAVADIAVIPQTAALDDAAAHQRPAAIPEGHESVHLG